MESILFTRTVEELVKARRPGRAVQREKQREQKTEPCKELCTPGQGACLEQELKRSPSMTSAVGMWLTQGERGPELPRWPSRTLGKSRNA